MSFFPSPHSVSRPFLSSSWPVTLLHLVWSTVPGLASLQPTPITPTKFTHPPLVTTRTWLKYKPVRVHWLKALKGFSISLKRKLPWVTRPYSVWPCLGPCPVTHWANSDTGTHANISSSFLLPAALWSHGCRPSFSLHSNSHPQRGLPDQLV